MTDTTDASTRDFDTDTDAVPHDSDDEMDVVPHDSGAGDESAPIDSNDVLEDANPNAEAARYRTRLREAEATNTALADQVAALQRQLIEGQCVAAGVKPLALWAFADLPDLLKEDGTVALRRSRKPSAR